MTEQTHILITPNPDGTGNFPATECTQSQLVFWRNEDPGSPHWPVFPDQPGVGPHFQTGYKENSDPVQPYASGTAIPSGQTQVVNYGCRISNHESEQGVVTVWPDFLAAQIQTGGVFFQLANGTAGEAYTGAVMTTGGKPPYTHTLTDVSLPKGLSVTDGPSGPLVSGTPGAAGKNFAFTL